MFEIIMNEFIEDVETLVEFKKVKSGQIVGPRGLLHQLGKVEPESMFLASCVKYHLTKKPL